MGIREVFLKCGNAHLEKINLYSFGRTSDFLLKILEDLSVISKLYALIDISF